MLYVGTTSYYFLAVFPAHILDQIYISKNRNNYVVFFSARRRVFFCFKKPIDDQRGRYETVKSSVLSY